MIKREFTVADEYHYNRSNSVRWIISHLLRYKHLIAAYMLAAILTNILYAVIPVLTGQAFNIVLQGSSARSRLPGMAFILLAIVLVAGCVDLSARFFPELLGKRITRDARAELYLSLLGKSQTFHNRQRVGDIMARAANDMTQLSNMVVPGFTTPTFVTNHRTTNRAKGLCLYSCRLRMRLKRNSPAGGTGRRSPPAGARWQESLGGFQDSLPSLFLAYRPGDTRKIPE